MNCGGVPQISAPKGRTTVREPSLKSQITELDEELEHLVEPLDDEQLLALTIEGIKDYRQLLQQADDAHQKWKQAKSCKELEQHRLKELESAYLDTLKRYHTQMALVACLTDRLGYVPTVDQADLSDEE